MNRFRLFLAGILGSLAFVSPAADTVDWMGASGGNYMEAANWTVRGTYTHRVPTADDIIVFNPGADVALTVACTASLGSYAGPARFSAIRVESGTVTLTTTENIGYCGKAGATNEIFVADGALFDMQFPIYPTGSCSLRKTGGGTLKLNSLYKWYYQPYRWQTCFVDAGTLWTTFYSGNYVRFDAYVVADGATLQRVSFPNPSDPDVTYEIQKGGRMDLDISPGGMACKGISGYGLLALNHRTAGTYMLQPSLIGGPYRFGGTMVQSKEGANLGFQNWSGSTTATADERHFVIDGANVFSNLTCFCAVVNPDFGRGIGEFYLPPIYAKNGSKFVLEDEGGEPIRLHASFCENSDRGSGRGSVVMEGAGDWYLRKGTSMITGNQVRVTGTISIPSDGTLRMGDGTAAGDMAFPFAAIENAGTLIVSNKNEATFAGLLSGTGYYRLYSPLTLEAISIIGKASAFYVRDGLVEVRSGTFTAPESTTSLQVLGSGTLQLTGRETRFTGPWVAWKVSDNNCDVLKGKRWGYLEMGGNKDATLEISDGALMKLGRYTCNMPNIRLLNGGTVYFHYGPYWRSASGATLQTLYSDGGILQINGLESPHSCPFPNTSDADKWVGKIGPGGLRILYDESTSGRYMSCLTFGDNLKTETADGYETDGGVILDATGNFSLNKPQNAKGPFVLKDGRIGIGAGFSTAGDYICGAGDLVFNGAWLGYFSNPTDAKTIRLANGAGAKTRIRSASRIMYDYLNSTTFTKRTGKVDFVLGPDSATSSSLVSENGAVLYAGSEGGNPVDGTGTTRLFVKGGVELYADGRTKVPILLSASTSDAQLATYSDENGLVKFTNYVSFDAADSEKAVQVGWTKGTNPTVVLPTGETCVGALVLRSAWVDASQTLVVIPAGATLKVGNGTDPAIVAVGASAPNSYTLLDGSGTLDFGTSRGVFASSLRANYVYTRQGVVKTRITGSGGVTFSAAAGVEFRSYYQSTTYYPDTANYGLAAANGYTGGTIIDQAVVRALNTMAFSTDPVTVIGGRMFGGAVCFACAGTFANDFTISGYGRRADSWDHQAQVGALEAQVAGVRLTGNVTVASPSRIGAPQVAEGKEAITFEGRVSGDRLEIFSGLVYGGFGGVAQRMTAVFTQDNASLTGGVKILKSNVVLRGAKPSLGTGEIYLESGTLRFENTARLATTNTMTGTAAVFQLAGEPEVTFEGDYSRLDSVTLDLCGMRHEFTVIPPFTNWISSASTVATIAVRGDGGTVAWPEGVKMDNPRNYDLQVGDGSILDLGGQTLRIRRALPGTVGRVTNGTLIQLSPRKGFMAIYR